MKPILVVLAACLSLLLGSCTLMVEQVISPCVSDSWVMIESDTEWVGEIDGWRISGCGDRVYYVEAECASVEKRSCCGYVRLTVSQDGHHPATSYTDASYGSVWVCE